MDAKLIINLYGRLLIALVVMIGSMGYLFSATPERPKRLMTGQTLEFLEENKTFMFVGNWEKGHGYEETMIEIAALIDIEIRFHVPQNYDETADPSKIFGVYLRGDGDGILLFLEIIHLDPQEFMEIIERLRKHKVPKHIV